MTNPPIPDSNAKRVSASRWRIAGEIGLIFLIFFMHGAWPVPEVNEPHYLSKAKHYWDPAWCANDFFCGTADAHQVFYWTFGWLSLFMPLPAMAWCGRLVTWGLLAWAWRRLSAALIPGLLYAVLSAALFVTLNSRLSMAGEWIIGGVEAKGFAYVLILLGLERLVRNQWGRAVLFFGAASSFHVILGGWSVVAAGVAWLASRDSPPLRRLVLPLAGGLLLALPGLLPAVALTRHVDPQVVNEANRIYVFERLGHHLVPQQFPSAMVARHLALITVWIVLAWTARLDDRQRRLRGFVAGAVGIAAAGFAISVVLPPDSAWSAALLRFYWFRLSDVMVPLGLSLIVASLLHDWQTARPRRHAWALAAVLILLVASLGDTIWRRQQYGRPLADASITNLAAWREACEWIAAETPPEAVFLTPRLAQTFRWYANRAEVVSRKDIPQDAGGIVEWWRRSQAIHRADAGSPNFWRESLSELGSDRLRQLGAEFGADYVITSAYPALNLERVGPLSPSIAIYRLPKASEPKRSDFDPLPPANP